MTSTVDMPSFRTFQKLVGKAVEFRPYYAVEGFVMWPVVLVINHDIRNLIEAFIKKEGTANE